MTQSASSSQRQHPDFVCFPTKWSSPAWAHCPGMLRSSITLSAVFSCVSADLSSVSDSLVTCCKSRCATDLRLPKSKTTTSANFLTWFEKMLPIWRHERHPVLQTHRQSSFHNAVTAASHHITRQTKRFIDDLLTQTVGRGIHNHLKSEFCSVFVAVKSGLRCVFHAERSVSTHTRRLSNWWILHKENRKREFSCKQRAVVYSTQNIGK